MKNKTKWQTTKGNTRTTELLGKNSRLVIIAREQKKPDWILKEQNQWLVRKVTPRSKK